MDIYVAVGVVFAIWIKKILFFFNPIFYFLKRIFLKVCFILIRKIQGSDNKIVESDDKKSVEDHEKILNQKLIREAKNIFKQRKILLDLRGASFWRLVEQTTYEVENIKKNQKKSIIPFLFPVGFSFIILFWSEIYLLKGQTEFFDRINLLSKNLSVCENKSGFFVNHQKNDEVIFLIKTQLKTLILEWEALNTKKYKPIFELNKIFVEILYCEFEEVLILKKKHRKFKIKLINNFLQNKKIWIRFLDNEQEKFDLACKRIKDLKNSLNL